MTKAQLGPLTRPRLHPCQNKAYWDDGYWRPTFVGIGGHRSPSAPRSDTDQWDSCQWTRDSSSMRIAHQSDGGNGIGRAYLSHLNPPSSQKSRPSLLSSYEPSGTLPACLPIATLAWAYQNPRHHRAWLAAAAAAAACMLMMTLPLALTANPVHPILILFQGQPKPLYSVPVSREKHPSHSYTSRGSLFPPSSYVWSFHCGGRAVTGIVDLAARFPRVTTLPI
ncbi:hypothetical protein LY76DRAFT_113026 [Colletotrichum caudatum]|nr:hypothetical protein LY76DRAFT_113026 [Colletotrichum caudatum]